MLPLLVWGTFTTEQAYLETAKQEGRSEVFPSTPGVFALQRPYESIVCVVNGNCPARYINDAIGVPGATNNIKICQHTNPRELYFDAFKGLHLLLQAQATRDIEEGEQLFLSYGEKFWEENGLIGQEEVNEEELAN